MVPDCINSSLPCRALWLMVPGIIVIVTLAVLVGMVMYAFYADCDPLKFKLIDRADQVCLSNALTFSLLLMTFIFWK